MIGSRLTLSIRWSKYDVSFRETGVRFTYVRVPLIWHITPWLTPARRWHLLVCHSWLVVFIPWFLSVDRSNLIHGHDNTKPRSEFEQRPHAFPSVPSSALPLPWLVGVALVVTIWIQPSSSSSFFPSTCFSLSYFHLTLLAWILMFGARYRSQADLSLLFKAFRVKRFPHHSTPLSLASKEEMPDLLCHKFHPSSTNSASNMVSYKGYMLNRSRVGGRPWLVEPH